MASDDANISPSADDTAGDLSGSMQPTSDWEISDEPELRKVREEPITRPNIYNCQEAGRSDSAAGTKNDSSADNQIHSRLAAPPLKPEWQQPVPDMNKLINGIHSNDAPTKVNSLYLLRHCFCTGRSPSLDMHDVGRLIELIECQSPEIQRQAMLALCIVIESKTKRLWAVEVGACPILIQLLASNDKRISELSMGALLKLASTDSKTCDHLIAQDIVPAFVSLAKRAPNEALITMCQHLTKILDVYDSAPAMCNAIMVFTPVVHQLLQHKSNPVVASTCRLLSYIALKLDVSCIQELAKLGTLQRLVKLLCSSDEYDIVMPALLTLGSVVTLSVNHVDTVVGSGALGAFKRILSQANMDIHVPMVMHAISSIVAQNKHRIQDVIDASLTPLIVMNLSGNSVKAAAGTVFNLTCGSSHDQIKLLIGAGVLRHLVHILAQLNGIDSATVLVALRALENIQHAEKMANQCEVFWESLDRMGALGHLQALQYSSDGEIRRVAAKLIFESWLLRSKQGAAEQTIIPKIDILVKGVYSKNFEIVLDHLRMSRLLAAKLSLPIHEFIKLNTEPRLVDLAEINEEPQIQYEAIWLLNHILAGTKDPRACVIETHACAILIELLEQSLDDRVVQVTLRALATTAASGPLLRDMLIELGLASRLVRLIARSDRISEKSLETAAGCVNNLFCHHSAPPPASIVTTCLAAVNDLLLSNTSAVILCACWSLLNITYGETESVDYHQTMADLGIIQNLVDIVNVSANSNNSKLLNSALMILGRISYRHPILLDQAVLPDLKRLLEKDDPDIEKHTIAWILANITCANEQSALAVVDEGLLPPLVKLLEQGYTVEVQQKAVLALHSIASFSSNDELSSLLHHENVLYPLIQLLGRSSDAALTVITMKALGMVLSTARTMNKGQALWKSLGEKDILFHLKGVHCFKDKTITTMASNLTELYWSLNQSG